MTLVPAVVASGHPTGLTPGAMTAEQIDLIKRTICKGRDERRARPLPASVRANATRPADAADLCRQTLGQRDRDPGAAADRRRRRRHVQGKLTRRDEGRYSPALDQSRNVMPVGVPSAVKPFGTASAGYPHRFEIWKYCAIRLVGGGAPNTPGPPRPHSRTSM